MKNLPRFLVISKLLAVPAIAAAIVPTTSPYVIDPQRTHVEDATSESIGTVNMIMCLMSGTRADALVNQGNYLALLDQNKCDSKSQSDSANSSATGGAAQASNYMTGVVNSVRAAEADPMRAKVWLEDTGGGGKTTIYVNVSATQAPSTADPYGVFRLDFCGRGDPAQPCMMAGYLEGKQDGSLSFYQTEQDRSNSGGGPAQITQLALTPTGTDKGSGSVQKGSVSGSNGFVFAYDPNLYLRSDGANQQCFSRDAADPQTGQSVWRYGLYDSTSGEHVDRNSGFPIEFSAGGAHYRGYLSYWGLSLAPDAAAALVNGATVSKADYGSATPTQVDFTVVKAAGKLTKYTKQIRTLQSLDQIRFNVWVGNDAASFFSGAVPNSSYELYWDDAVGVFKVTGVMACGNNGCETHSFATGQEKSVGVAFWANHAGISGSSNSLGGELFIDLKNVADPVQSSAVHVVYRVQDMVYPSDYPATLYCVRDCPTAATIGSYFTAGSTDASPFTAGTFNNWSPLAAAGVVSYTPSIADALLKDGAGQNVVFTDAAAMASNPQYQNGLRTGRLVADLATAECAPGTGQYCDYQVQNADIYYVWETGPKPWNQFAAVKDATGKFVAFDAPLSVNYSVPNDAVRYGVYAGKTLVLQYGGFGQLWGIPGVCVSRDSNAPVSCDTANSRYVPAFVIPYDATLGVVTSAGVSGPTSYLVKWLDREIRFASKDPSVCATANLTLPASVQLPTAAGLNDPSDPASTIYIGAEPTVTDPVRVIQGEIKW
jgi:hypothetical protein